MYRGRGLFEAVGYMGSSWNRDYQLESKNVLKDVTDNALTISGCNLFQMKSAWTLNATVGKAFLLVEHIRMVGWVKIKIRGKFQKAMGDREHAY